MSRWPSDNLAALVRASRTPLSYDAVRSRLRRGLSLEEAVSRPPACDKRPERLGADEEIVLAAARRLEARGFYPSRARLAAEAGRSEMTVRLAIRRLRRRGRCGWIVGPGARRYSDRAASLADRLHDEGLCAAEVARRLGRRLGLRVHAATVRTWLGLGRFGDDPEAIARRAAEIRRGVAS